MYDGLPLERKQCAKKGHKWGRANAIVNLDTFERAPVTMCMRCTAWAKPDASPPKPPLCYRCSKPATVWVEDVGACANHFLKAQGGTYRLGDPVKPLVTGDFAA